MIKLCNTLIDDKYIVEKLTFIVDNPRIKDDEKYEYGRNFAKQFGYKSDCVGWVSDITPDAEKLKRIFEMAEKESVSIRADYELKLSPDYESSWYFMHGKPRGGYLSASEWCSYNGHPLGQVKAFSIPDNIKFTKIGCTDFLMLREDVMTELVNEGFTGNEYVWCPDKGRYRSPQYFQNFPQHILPYWYQSSHKRITPEMASTLTESARLIATNSTDAWIGLPMAVDLCTLPQCDFAATYPSDNHDNRVLVRKRVRDHLIEKKLAKADDFEPILVGENLTAESAFPLNKRIAGDYVPLPQDVMDAVAKEYAKSLKKEKPIRAATEKSALSKLRYAKKEEPELFGKKASEKKLASIIDERLAPYYKVADGGALSDEYSYFSIEDSLKENKEFWELQCNEDTDLITRDAKVFGVAADGENILLMPDGSVVRYQQGEVQFNTTWNNLPSFFVEAIEE